MTESRTYSQRDLAQMLREHVQRTDGRLVLSVTFAYDRPAVYTPSDPGNGVTATVVLGEHVQ